MGRWTRVRSDTLGVRLEALDVRAVFYSVVGGQPLTVYAIGVQVSGQAPPNSEEAPYLSSEVADKGPFTKCRRYYPALVFPIFVAGLSGRIVEQPASK